MKTKLIYLIFIFLVVSCQINNSENNTIQNTKTIHKIKWLIGYWKLNSTEGVSTEIWNKENDSLYTGTGLLVKDKDTLFSEKFELKQINDDLFYVATVKGQNDDKPISFKFTEIKNGEFNFVNLQHDFPTHIIYKNPQPDFLCVRIEGTQNGKFAKSDFSFLRITK